MGVLPFDDLPGAFVLVSVREPDDYVIRGMIICSGSLLGGSLVGVGSVQFAGDICTGSFDHFLASVVSGQAANELIRSREGRLR